MINRILDTLFSSKLNILISLAIEVRTSILD